MNVEYEIQREIKVLQHSGTQYRLQIMTISCLMQKLMLNMMVLTNIVFDFAWKM